MSSHPRALLRERGLVPKKKFGQNFLMDGGATQRIAALCVPHEGERVVEIGAGTGALTHALVERGANVTAIEVDPDLIAILRARDDLAPATIVEADALTYDFETAGADAPWCAAGNLPYNIATPLVLRWLEMRHPPETIVVMVQRDVADRFLAKPSTPEFGSLSLAVQYRMDVRRAMVLGPEAFYPRPRVKSAVVVMQRRAKPIVVVRDEPFFLQVVRAAFAYRRKTLANSLALALGIARERTQESLRELGFDTEIRGEQLDLGAFARLADRLGP
jgi:16S rRNA (adenine1518-N6/adenine1519-N6)-dimethyltransferase